ncbi:hypothetical protein EDB19DRAFT_1776590 [Suillus lakei]|nr:hypothetical protein EDB19DRAFT_1776590 [Suillus lakei]
MPSTVMSIMQGPLCGALATMLLYGIICMQTFRYWQVYKHDRKILKILETAHTALSIYSVEFYLIMHFGDMTNLQSAVWGMPVSSRDMIAVCIAYSVNICFIWRVLQRE